MRNAPFPTLAARLAGAALLACLAASAATADDLTIPLPAGTNVERIAARYSCGDEAPFKVTYINAGPNSLAIVPVGGETLVFVNVLSGSGARYASGPYVWWTKGDGADLYDLRQGEDAAPVECREAP